MTRPTLSLTSLIAVVLTLGFLTADEARAQQDGQLLDGVVAVVGTHPILASDVAALAHAMARGSTPTTALQRTALDDLIAQQAISEYAMRDTTLTVSEEEVSIILEERTQELVQQMGGEDAVVELYNRSVVQLQQDYRSDVRRQLFAQAAQRQVYFGVNITPPEVREWFARIPSDSLPEVPELVRVAHIVRFAELEPEARQEALTQIEAIRDSIEAGTPIETMADRHSEDPGSQGQGGRYAGVNLRDLVPEFGAVAGTLQPGELSHIFESNFGYHVMRLNSRRGDLLDFNHVLIQLDQNRTDPTSALETLTMVRDSVVNKGASFGRLAREFSEEPESASRGGNVIVPQTGDRDLRFEALGADWRTTLDTLEVGEVSMPTQVTLLDGRPAYHVVMLQRRVEPHLLSLESDYVLVEEFALQEKRQAEMEKWIEEVREKVAIACLDDNLCRNGAGTAAAGSR